MYPVVHPVTSETVHLIGFQGNLRGREDLMWQGSRLYAGLREGVDSATLRSHIESGSVEDTLHTLEVSAGDCVFIPAGTVHAIGEGVG